MMNDDIALQLDKELKENLNVDFDVESCSICFNDLTDNYFITDCKHKFHMGCIRRWLFSQSTCPLCRSQVSVSYQNLFAKNGNDIHFDPFAVVYPNNENIIHVFSFAEYPENIQPCGVFPQTRRDHYGNHLNIEFRLSD